jgi:hypothetical protein
MRTGKLAGLIVIRFRLKVPRCKTGGLFIYSRFSWTLLIPLHPANYLNLEFYFYPHVFYDIKYRKVSIFFNF